MFTTSQSSCPLLIVDAKEEQKEPGILADEYIEILKRALKIQPVHTIINQPSDVYEFFINYREVIIKAGIGFLAFIILLIILFVISKIFRRMYAFLESGKGTRFKSITVRNNEIVSDETVVSTLVLAVRGVRLAITVGLLYLFITVLFILFPWAKSPSIKGIIRGILLTVLTAAIGLGLYKTLKMVMELVRNNISDWKGSIIRPLKLKTVEILTEDQIVEILKKAVLAIQVSLNLLLVYLFIPIVLSYFEFTSTWADTLFGYILNPLKTIFASFIRFLPNIFFIAVIMFRQSLHYQAYKAHL